MPIDFPASPTNGQTYTYNGVLYTYTAQGMWTSAGIAGLPAAPFDAMAYSGMQINGSMEVSQELGLGAPPTSLDANLKFIADGWKVDFSTATGGASANGQQVTDAPPGYSNSIKVVVTGADLTPTASAECGIFQFVEGYRIARLGFGTANAQPMSIAFWIKAHRPGLYSGSVRSGVGDRSYPYPITVNAADTWEYKTVTIPGDTLGTWAKDNASGMRLSFSAMEGSGYLGAPNTWFAGNLKGVTGMINGVGVAGDTFQITGVVILPGIQAPTAAQSPLIMRPYDQELLTCQRYYRKLGGGVLADILLAGYQVAGQVLSTSFPLIPNMRTTPTVARFGTWVDNGVSVTSYFASSVALGWQLTASTTGAVSSYTNAGGGLALDARL